MDIEKYRRVIKLSSVFDSEVTRIYRCHNEECEAEIVCKEKLSDPWKHQCPFCEKNELYLSSSTDPFTILKDLKNPNTVGMLAQKNTDRKVKEENLQIGKKKRPWWRKTDKLDFSILKNPKKFIETGEK